MRGEENMSKGPQRTQTMDKDVQGLQLLELSNI